MERPTFHYDGNPVRAAGILFWTEINGVRWKLLRHYKGRWQDIGGKTDNQDENFMDTAVREAKEETNDKFLCTELMYDALKNPKKTKVQYDAKCKYILFKCYVEPKFQKLKDFGENENGKPHRFKWFKKLPKLHFRLRKFVI